MVERFFRNLTVNRLRRGVFRDVIELVASINTTSSPSLWASRLFNSAGYPEHHDATASLGQEVDRLRKSGEVRCSDRIGEKLKRISPKTIDRLLTGERQTRRLRKNRNAAVHLCSIRRFRRRRLRNGIPGEGLRAHSALAH